VRLVEEALDRPLNWKKPRRIFVNSMSDLFHEAVPDDWLDSIFRAMMHAPQHIYQILTKRPERMLAYLRDQGLGWPWRHVWLGVSVEDQATADERIPLLLQTPAAVRWVSYEPALGPVSFRWASWEPWNARKDRGEALNHLDGLRRLDWIVVGGESGPGARPFDYAWARSTITQCRTAGVPVFVKQLGARGWNTPPPGETRRMQDVFVKPRDRKGGDPTEWPEDLRVREYPTCATPAS
jgi:protein gp37